jgi:hypothetical protein
VSVAGQEKRGKKGRFIIAIEEIPKASVRACVYVNNCLKRKGGLALV